MQLRVDYTPHTLKFRFDARTSRGALAAHTVYLLRLRRPEQPDIIGVGECAPLKGLSIDDRPDLVQKIEEVVYQLNQGQVALEFGKPLPDALQLQEWPALHFALETALLDLQHGGRGIVYDNPFSRGECSIPINGLIWMGDASFMQEQIENKLQEGYTCLKLKIGSLDFVTELAILQRIREVASARDLTIRVDANGAFSPEDAFKKLERLARYDVHSIEQPIRQGQPAHMAQLCAYTPVPIALDEELIGVHQSEAKEALLNVIKPQYIILKPTLLGGLAASAGWISLAEKYKTGWWVTSALESNIGLNAVSQFTATYPITMPQGLGTGQLYHNNFPSLLQIAQGQLWRKVDATSLT